MRFWSQTASLEVVTNKESEDLLRLDAGTPLLVLSHAYTEAHAERTINALMAWLKKREELRAGKRPII